jgi:hypothetical protein
MQRFFTRLTADRSGDGRQQPHDPPVPLIVAMIALGMFVGAMLAPAETDANGADSSPAAVTCPSE